MTPSFEQIRDFAHELPAEQKILLANSLWESTAWGDEEASEAEVAAAWEAEIGHRVAGIKAGTAQLCSLDELSGELDTITRR